MCLGHKLFTAAALLLVCAGHVSAQESVKTFGGVGLKVTQILDAGSPNKQGALIVTKVLSDTPAQLAGIGKGDMITKVNGTDVRGLPIAEIVAKIRGTVGEKVALTLVEEDGQEFTQELTRVELVEGASCSK